MEQNAIVRLLILGVLVLFSVVVYMPENGGAIFGQSAGFSLSSNTCERETLCVSFLDVGQGDAIFIESPTGRQVLIDGGPDSSVLRALGEVMGFFDKDIDVVVATHSDADHISGLIDVLERYDVGTVIRTENESDTPMWHAFEESTEAEEADIRYARRGQTYDLGGGAVLEVLFPDRDVSDMESNTASIVMRLSYGNTSFLLMGDAPKSIEEYLVLIEGEHLKSDVLKVGHHGSRTSTSELLLAEVRPTYAVISAGRDNRYGHPHLEVTDLLFNYGVKIFNTADEGTVQLIVNDADLQVR